MDKVDILLEPVRGFLMQLGGFLPKLLLASLIVLVGWIFAKVLKLALSKGLRGINFNVLTERAGIDGFLKQGGIEIDTIGVLAMLAYWLVILVALMVAFGSLGLPYVTEAVGRVALFVPKIMLAVFILAFGAYFAYFIDRAVAAYGRNVGLADAELLGRVARYAILLFVVLVALEQVDVAIDLIHDSFLIILGGVVLALALAFGLGARRRAGELLERWWPADRPDRGHADKHR
jgi:hypothetical protein